MARITAFVLLFPIITLGLSLIASIVFWLSCSSIADLASFCTAYGVNDLWRNLYGVTIFYLFPASLIATPIAIFLLKKVK